MPKFKVTVTRKVFQTREIEVEADDKMEAAQKAKDNAGDYNFANHEHDAEYEVDYVEEVTE